jgi:hypothetical protein
MRKWLMLACLLTMEGASAQVSDLHVESLTVHASPMVGVWKLAWPQWGRIPGNRWGPLGDRYCRIGERRGDLEIHCLTRGGGANNIAQGAVSVTEDQVSFTWGSIFSRMWLEGKLQSPIRIDARMGARIAGFQRENPAPVSATKLSFSEDAPDLGERTVLLRTALQQLASGKLTLPHDAEAIEDNGGELPNDIKLLGALKLVTHLGPSFRETATSLGNGVPVMDLESFRAFAVEFEHGQRLCGLHQRADGMLDYFRCV